MRLKREQLDKIKKENNVDTIWSYSKVNTFQTSMYEYYLKYIKLVNEDRKDCGYAPIGSIVHDILDDFYEGKIKYEDMINAFEDGWLTCIDIAELKLDRNDEEKNKKLSEKYKENLIHFFKNHNVYHHKLHIEMPVVVNANNNIFVGYIDALYKDNNGDIFILDFKSSSIYSGKTLEEHSQQLQLYCLGIHQKTGLPLEKIHCGFNFLKYVTIKYQQKNGAVKSRNTDRCKIGEALQSNAKTWLKHYGYEPDEYLKLLLDTNNIDCLPDEVKEKYVITDCHVYVDTSEKEINKLIDNLSKTIIDIELRTKDYFENKSDKCFWDSEDSVKAQSYYYATLCGYSANLLLPYKEYLEKLEQEKNGNLFANVGSNIKNNDNGNNDNVNIEDNLSWLDEI